MYLTHATKSSTLYQAEILSENKIDFTCKNTQHNAQYMTGTGY